MTAHEPFIKFLKENFSAAVIHEILPIITDGRLHSASATVDLQYARVWVDCKLIAEEPRFLTLMAMYYDLPGQSPLKLFEELLNWVDTVDTTPEPP